MKCDVCNKEFTFLYFIGKNNVCNKCIAKHTVFKEVDESEDAILRKAMRSFDVNSFDDLKNINKLQIEKLKKGLVKDKNRPTFKYKDNKNSAVNVGSKTEMDPQEEYDIE